MLNLVTNRGIKHTNGTVNAKPFDRDIMSQCLVLIVSLVYFGSIIPQSQCLVLTVPHVIVTGV
jgi:hypothetical protein